MNNLLEKHFHLSKYSTNPRQELLAGITTFFTMSYVLAAIPNMFGSAGLNRGNYLIFLICIIIIAGICTALYTNRPFVLAPELGGMGIVTSMMVDAGIAPDAVTGIILVNSLLLLLVTFSGIRDAVVNQLPLSLKYAISAGLGLFIAMVGLKSCGLIVVDGVKHAFTWGDITKPAAFLALIGLFFLVGVIAKNIKGGTLWVILCITLLGIPFNLTVLPDFFITFPQFSPGEWVIPNLAACLNPEYLPYMFALFASIFFSPLGTITAVAQKANFLDCNGNLPNIKRYFRVESLATGLGGLVGMPNITTYLESSAGVDIGGRTGLTTLCTCLCFGLMLFFTPLALMIPTAATAPILIFIGISMLSAMKNINYDDFSECFPAFICISFTVFANNIASGICASILMYILLKAASGKIAKLPATMYFLSSFSILYFYVILF